MIRSPLRLIRRTALYFLVMGLASCALVTKAPAPVPVESQKLLGLSAWRLNGRIGVQTARDAWHASLSWEHADRQDRLRVSGPFGQGAVSIILQDKLILIRESTGETKTSGDPEGLLRSALGFAVPLSSLRYWVLGLPEPVAANDPTYSDTGTLRELRQVGWRLRYDQYMQVDGYSLPRKMLIQGKDLSLKLIVDEWALST